MADHVEQLLQDCVEELDDLSRKRIFNESEIKHIVRRRRDYEYLLKNRNVSPQDYLNYIRYEVALECLRRRRSKALHWRTKTVSDYTGLKRLHFIFDRGIIRFKGDVRFWYQYIDFCLRSGSTKKLSSVLYRAVRYHPRKIHLWLLAADRELKCGHIDAARKLLLRGLRFAPHSGKLWGEFLRLEFQVAYCLNVRASKGDYGDTAQAPMDTEEEGKDSSLSALTSAISAAHPTPTTEVCTAAGEELALPVDPWAPTRLLFRRGFKKLRGKPSACVGFLTTAMHCLQEAGAKYPGKALDELATEVHSAIAECRPGMATGTEWIDVPAEIAVGLWELWWKQQRACQSDWCTISSAVAAAGPSSVMQRFAVMLMEAALSANNDHDEAPLRALLELANAPRTATSSIETALTVLEALGRCVDADAVDPTAGATIFRSFLQRATLAHPSCARLRALAWQQLPLDERPACATDAKAVVSGLCDVSPSEATQLLLLVTDAKTCEATNGQTFEMLLRALSPAASPAPLVDTFLGGALARGGMAAFHVACGQVLAVAKQVWDAPRLRVGILASVLNVQLRLITPADKSASQLCAQFEELLQLLDDDEAEKVDWWVRYLAFVHRMTCWGCGSGLPTSTDLHWRAMRSVNDQAAYREKAHEFLQSGQL